MADDFAAIREHAARIQQKIALAKRNLQPVDFEWYPSDTLSAFIHLDRMLTGANRALFSSRKRILDVGCQDGELSFCLEAAGHEVVALDHPTYNHNGMRGIRALKDALGSAVPLCDVDLDRQFSLPPGDYDLAIVLGVLYHLRNPFYVLEELAQRASWCLLSTRIARRFPDGKPMPPDVSIAYLLEERELNEDETNYFIFSEKGLRTLLSRTHWDICDFVTAGSLTGSDPTNPARDERFFCLLQSRYGRLAHVEFLGGWHQPEESGWRWIARQCSARIGWQSQRPPRELRVELFIPEQLIERAGGVCLSIAFNGVPLPAELYQSCGLRTLVRKLPRLEGTEFLLQFSLSAVLPPDQSDARERGIVVSWLSLA